MIILLEPLIDNAAVDSIDEGTFQYYLQWSTSGHTGGPTVVAENLLKELRLRQDLAWTVITPVTRLDRSYSVMWVVNGLEDLIWAIENKVGLGVRELWAGPNLVVVPQEGQGIIGHPLIDRVIVPCDWPGEVYAQLMPPISNKIVSWPVGIDVEYWRPDQAVEKQFIVIYDKRNTAVADELTAGLCAAGEKVSRITYGEYTPEEYKALLNQAKAMVWLSATESQGIALLEALAMNVPVLCWKNTIWNYYSPELNLLFQYDGASSAPYFSDSCGVFFENVQDFLQIKYPKFCKKIDNFLPRKYLFENNLVVGKSLTDVVAEFKKLNP